MRLVLILAALGAPQTTIDRTLSCPVIQEGQAFVVNATTSVTTPRSGAFLKFWPTPLAFDEPAVLPGVEIDSHPGKIVWDPRGRCDSSSERIPFVPRGLKRDIVVTTHFVGSANVTCRAAPRVRFRTRVSVRRGEPTHAQLIVVAGRRAKPILYTDWTPSRIAVWVQPDCND